MMMLPDKLVPISEAKGHLSELAERSHDRDVVLLRHGKPHAVMVGYDRYERLIEDFQDALDRLSIHERDHDTVSFDKVAEELGLD